MATYGLKIFAGNSNRELAHQICDSLEMPLGRAMISTFSDGEIRVEIGENVRGADIFVVQSGAQPVNDHLMELLVMIDAFKRASARRITAVIPYYSYARQDRKNKPRVPITARLVADLIARVGAQRILTMDLHAGQIQGFFDVPVDNLYASPILLPYIREHFNGDMVIVSPDAGGVPRARAYAKILKAGLAMIDKRRSDVNKAEALHIIGEVSGKAAVVLDDMVDTAGTLVEATKSLLDKGATEVHACVTHAVLSGPAIDRIENSALKKLVVTDTLPLRPQAAHCRKIEVVPSCRLFSAAIRNIHNEDSISTLFEILH
ncbi:ribose-phosphate diphosphokinase [Syntrophobacter fumaroxidans]|uniref:Ribose-phosphate pyrophosphokinase n=1 Tax=Syntrophobacter fumaroxidans (strain DSM 10017 / MPOB) TaxID=335543 RepID=A0LHJ9_SYNFM|nr:ribose-phosphate pyrophosphokinase [Syntrophobacter fumaroxidans]ABK16901.1 ribose-phosphate pyrophosphokinase [Syntrophobacter fumaroxidans MPOB]